DLEASYTYNDEGQVATVKTPDAYGPSGAPPGWVAVPGTTFTYTYDTMGRPSKLTANGADSVKDAVYGPAGELKSLWYSGVTETRTYNSRLQVTRITAVLAGYGSAGTMDIEYRYAANQNNGQVVQTKDWVTGEEVTYQYDALERLMHAETTGPEWGTTYTYDGFGNLTGKVTTKGTAPVLSVAVDPATNRMVGQSYSASGALLSVTSPGVATALYDVENRLVAPNSNDALRYDYDPQNKRVWSYAGSGADTATFFGVDGRFLGSYTFSAQWGKFFVNETAVYFAGRKIGSPGAAVYDRLGTKRLDLRGPFERAGYFPYGEEQQATTSPKEYATYTRGAAGLDYADQRYYASTSGRFLTPDPYRASAAPENPQSWNRYAYVGNDPVNWNDPRGLERIDNACDVYPNSPGCSFLPSCDVYPMPGCDPKLPPRPVPDCYRPEAPDGHSVDANVSYTEAIASLWQDIADLAPATERQEASLAASLITLVWWIDKVKPGGDWDYKRRGSQYENFGNFNYGATAAALQIPYYATQNAAGIVNIGSNVLTMVERLFRKFGGDETPLPKWWIEGIPLVRWPFGDASKDAQQINAGWAFYQSKKKGDCK